MKKKRTKGRPALTDGKKSYMVNARFSKEEYDQLLALEAALDISRTNLIRSRVLNNANQHLINAQEMIAALDAIGTEIGRAGNNINQLARYANILRKQNILSAVVVERLNFLLDSYHQKQEVVEATLRKIIRMMSRT